MSRTFRCKNYIAENQTSWDRHGGKIAGSYTEYDLVGFEQNGYFSKLYRPPTDRERFKKFYFHHGESRSSYDRSPGPRNRIPRMRQNRSIVKNEICKAMNPEYDAIFEVNPRNCAWDWR